MLLKFSNKFGAMMFGRSVEGNQVIDIFHQVWHNNDVWMFFYGYKVIEFFKPVW